MSAAPMRADDDHEERREKVEARRYYDRHARDWHSWDDNEQRHYQRYIQENRRDNREFNRLRRNQQDQYFRWRHEHSDDNR